MKPGIVIPAFNEQAGLPLLIRQIEGLRTGADICVVDDSPGYLDAKSLEDLAPGRLTVIRRAAKSGRGSAVLLGMEHLLKRSCDLIIEMDADLSHPPARLPELMRESSLRKTDLLIASRYLNGSSVGNWPLRRRLFSRAANLLARFILGVPVKDYTNGFRAYSRRAAQTAVATCGGAGKGFIVLSEILVNLYYRGYSVAETPLSFSDRASGKSTLNCAEISGALAGLFKVWRLKKEIIRSGGKAA